MAKEEAKITVKPLEQQPHTDTISRQAALNLCEKFDGYVPYSVLSSYDMLPPINSQSQTGHWVFDDECKEHGHCSCCGYGSIDLVDGEPHNFCRKCGAWMVEPKTERDAK